MREVVRMAGIPVMVGLIFVSFALAQANYHHRAFAVTTVAPIVVTDLSTGGGFVVGTDGVARTCPDAKYVAEYIRAEGKGSQLFFQYFDRKVVLISTPDHGYTLACLKVE